MNETTTSKETAALHELATQPCVPCAGGAPALKGEALASLFHKLDHGWQLLDEHQLEKEFHFNDFREALDFTNRVGAIAEELNHHPDIYLTWGKVRLNLFTHKVNGLTQNDFVLAAKIEELQT